MNRVLLIINSLVLAVVLAMGVFMMFELSAAQQHMADMPTMKTIDAVRAEDQALNEALGKVDQSVTQTDERLLKLSRRLESLPSNDEIQSLRKALASAEESRREMAGRLDVMTREVGVMQQAETELLGHVTELRVAWNAATAPEGDPGRGTDSMTKLKTSLQAASIDLTGQWLHHNEPTPNTIKVSIARLSPGKYKMVTGGNSGGVYKIEGDQLVMTEPGNENYTGFVWKIKNPDELVLLTTQYKGSRMERQKNQDE